MKKWHPDTDPATIPDDVLRSERSRRIARLRKTYTGGTTWANHNPNTNRCRCLECKAVRDEKKIANSSVTT